MKPKQIQTVVLLLVIGAAVVIGLLPRHRDLTPTLPEVRPTTRAVAAPAQSAPPAQTVAHPAAGFRSRAQLLDHFDRHGRDFRARSADEYLKLAQALRDAPTGGTVLETIRTGDGVVTRFDRRSGAFLAFNPDGTIRTFFKP